MSQLSSPRGPGSRSASAIPDRHLIYASAAACAMFGGIVVWLSHNASAYSVTAFTVISTIQLGIGFLVVTHYQRRERAIPLAYILGSAVILRGIALLGVPLFEDDFYRYLFDGYLTATTGDPYSLAPSAFFANETLPENVDTLLSQINFPDIATVYGPVTQWIFAATWLLAPGEVWPFQLAAGLADLAVLLMVARLCQSYSQRNFLLLYAWSPLMIKEFTLTAHPDIYAIAFGLLALSLMRNNRWLLCGLIVSLAAGAKVFAILLIPLMMFYSRSWHATINMMAGFITGILLITLSFGTPAIWFPEGLGAMARYWIFNAPVYRTLEMLIPVQALKLLALFTVFLVICWRIWKLWGTADSESRSATLYRGYLWIYAVLMLCLPALNPWYVCWLLPFAVLWPSRWPFVWSVLVLMAYYIGTNLGGPELHQVSDIVIAIQLFGVVAAMLIDWRYPVDSALREN